MKKNDIKNYSADELARYFNDLGEKAFRITQVFEWLYQKNTDSFDAMKNMPKKLREKLARDFSWGAFKSTPLQKKSSDGTVKFLFTLYDGETIETVLIPTQSRTTVCVSTQVGCKFACRFCASGVDGWRRNLTCAEILEQILHAKGYVKNHIEPVSGFKHQANVTHVVFMGVGEPLDNYDQVLKAVRIINSPQAFGIAARRITISTCGLIPQIERLKTAGLQIELSVSLHGYNDAVRRQLMPVSSRYGLSDLITACREYSRATKRQITFEYILIKDLTCSKHAADALAHLLKGLLCKINLIPFNKVIESPYSSPSRREVLAFRQALQKKGIVATIRTPRGQDIEAACGQLRYGQEKSPD